MKNLLLTTSPVLLYEEPRRSPPYFGAIIRRHRFLFLLIVSLFILIVLNWAYQKREKNVFYNKPVLYINEDYNGENELLESNVERAFVGRKISEELDENEQQHKNLQTLSKHKEIETFLHLMTEKQKTEFLVEEFKLFIPIQQRIDTITTKGIRQQNKLSVIGDGKANTAPTRQYLKIESSSPPKDGVEGYTKYFNPKESSSTILHGNKAVSLSPIQQPGEDFPVPYQKDERAKTEVTSPFPRNRTVATGVFNIKKHITLNLKKSSPIELNITGADKSPLFLIDTPGCKIPKLDPWDPTIKHLIELQDPYECPGPPVFLKSNPGGFITFNKTILETYYNITPEELDCFYQPIFRNHEEKWSDHREIAFSFGNKYPLDFEVPLNTDFVAVSCNIKGKNYKQYLPLVCLKEEVEERKSIISSNPTLNVILLGIDSVSKLNFLRHFPKTHAFLNEKLLPFEMKGYNKVADNTFPNIIPLLTGQFVEHWWNETMKNIMYFDDVGFIWKEYAKKGYRTFFAEDNPFFGIFNYYKRGFNNPPTDYYFRPLAIALEMLKLMLKPEKEFCLNSETMFDIIFEHLKVFTETMEPRPYFSFTMVSSITHDYLNDAGWADEPTERLLEGLLNSGTLNNSLLVLFSDHGMRFGDIRSTYIGKYEDRLPLMYIHVPSFFLDNYPEIAKNLQANQDRLITLFDVHATMIHLLDLSKNHTERSVFSLGKSLFEEISSNRTCSDANIQTHWCTCQTFHNIDTNSPEVINASQAIVNDINHNLKPYKKVCEILEVDTIMDARVGTANDKMLQYRIATNEAKNITEFVEDEVTSLDDYMVTVITKPGGAAFEGTVRHNPVDNNYSVLGLSRINMYGNTSWCIDSQSMKLFCYCKMEQMN